jgi:hypothetical protein
MNFNDDWFPDYWLTFLMMGPYADEQYRKISFNPQNMYKSIKSITTCDVLSDLPASAGRNVRRYYASKATNHKVGTSNNPVELLSPKSNTIKQQMMDSIINLNVSHKHFPEELTLQQMSDARIQNLLRMIDMYKELQMTAKVIEYQKLYLEAAEKYEMMVSNQIKIKAGESLMDTSTSISSNTNSRKRQSSNFIDLDDCSYEDITEL